MGSLEIALDGLPILVLVGCIGWIVRFNISQQKGERLTLKWKDMGPLRKTVAGLILAWIRLNLYLTVADLLAFLNVVALPLGSAYSIHRPILLSPSASPIVAIGFVLSL